MPNSEHEIHLIADNLAASGYSIRDLETRAIQQNWDVQTFREAALLRSPIKPIRAPQPLEMKPKDWARYSIARAIRMQLPDQQKDGIEHEVSQEIGHRLNKRSEGLWLPPEVLGRNFVSGTGTLGGMLVQTDNLGDQFIELLRPASKVLALGARVLNLSGPATVPRQNASGSVNWVGETVAATLSTGNFTQITLTPNGLSAFQQYSKQLLFEGNPTVDNLIRDDILQSLGTEIDRVCLHGTGSGQPTGITATTGVTTIALGANGAAFSVANGRSSMLSLESAVAVANADGNTCAYLSNAKMRGRLKAIDQSQATNVARWVWQQTPNLSEVNGYKAEVSNQVSAIQTQGTATTICSSVFFGNWQEVLIAQFNNGAVDMVVDPYTLAVNGVVRVIARQWVDIGVRHGASFSVLLGVLDA